MTCRLILLAVLLGASGTAARADGPQGALPAMNFHSTIAGRELYALIKAHATFARLDDRLIGSPIVLRVSHSLRPTAGGNAAGLVSAIWSGGTPGLLPMVTNNSFVVTYEVRVQGKDVASYSFRRRLTRAIDIRAQDDATYGLGKEGLEWLKSTVGEFTAAASRDPALAALQREYDAYFAARR